MTVVVASPSQAGAFDRNSFMLFQVCGASARNAPKRPTTVLRPRRTRDCSITSSHNRASAGSASSARCALGRLGHYQQKHKIRHVINYDGARTI